jgi:hypothetical protein
LAGSARAQNAAIDLASFAQELQRTEAEAGQFKMVWWIPTEYWQESFRQAPMTQAQKDAFVKAVDDYIIVAIVDANITPLAGLDARSLNDIRANLSIKVGDSQISMPLADEAIANETRSLMAVMKPAFANMLGQFGKGMELVCFKGKDEQGRRLLDPRGNGMLNVTYKNKRYSWRLPLGSLLPPKYDAQTGEKYPGNYVFSPFTGAKLTDKAPPSDARSAK